MSRIYIVFKLLFNIYFFKNILPRYYIITSNNMLVSRDDDAILCQLYHHLTEEN